MAWQLGRKEECAVTVHVHYYKPEGHDPPDAMWLAADPASCLDLTWDWDPEMGDEADEEEENDLEGTSTPSGAGVLVPSKTKAGLYSVVVRFKRGSTAKLRVRAGGGGVGGYQSANGANTVVEIPDAAEATLHLTPTFHHEWGAVHRLADVHSPQLGNDRHIWVYLPPSYTENTAIVYDKVLVQWDGQIVRDKLFRSTLDAAILGGDMGKLASNLPAVPCDFHSCC